MPYPENFDIQAAARHLKERYERHHQKCAERRERAIRFAEHLAKTLGASDKNVRKIIGFGSTFESWRNYRLDSDIDLAIVGGNWSYLMGLIPPSEFQVSLIELELQNREFQEYVLKKGVVLYEKF